VIAVAATIVVSLLVGVGAERRFAERAQAWARTVLTVTLYGLLPFVGPSSSRQRCRPGSTAW
jgi:hypothetical protein